MPLQKTADLHFLLEFVRNAPALVDEAMRKEEPMVKVQQWCHGESRLQFVPRRGRLQHFKLPRSDESIACVLRDGGH